MGVVVCEWESLRGEKFGGLIFLHSKYVFADIFIFIFIVIFILFYD